MPFSRPQTRLFIDRALSAVQEGPGLIRREIIHSILLQ
jgi:hypothetical protein